MSAIIVDCSAFTAILNQESEADAFSVAIRGSPYRSMAAATYLECAIVMSRRRVGRTELDAWLLREPITVVPVDHTLAQIAADAFAPLRHGPAPRRPQLRRLLCLRARPLAECASPVQGRRLSAHPVMRAA